MEKKDIYNHVLITLNLYFNNGDWLGYLDSIKEAEEVREEMQRIFGENNG